MTAYLWGRMHLYAVCCALLALTGCVTSRPHSVRVPLKTSTIVLPQDASSVQRFAAEELAAHLKLISGSTVPIRRDSKGTPDGAYVFRIAPPDGATRPELTDEEARYEIGHSTTVFYGDDRIISPNGDYKEEAVSCLQNHVGTLFAVYEFLDRECDVRWLMPGPDGVQCPQRQDLLLSPRRVVWKPSVRGRRMMFPTPAQAGTAAQSKTWEQALWGRRHRFGLHLHCSALVQDEAEEGGQCTQWTITVTPDRWAEARDTRAALREARKNRGALLMFAPKLPLGVAGVPIGCEEHALASVRAAMTAGADCLCLPGNAQSWWHGGLASYALARAISHADTPFVLAEAEFCSAFGAAASDTKAYYQFWRDHFGTKLLPTSATLTAPGNCWQARVGAEITAYYSLEDFRAAAVFLDAALTRELTPRQRRQLQELHLAHKHAELIFLATKAHLGTMTTVEELKRGLKVSRCLTDFRQHFGKHLHQCVPSLAAQERSFGDVTGTEWAQLFKGVEPFRTLPATWQVRADPKGVGLTEKWFTAETGAEDWRELQLGPSLTSADDPDPTDDKPDLESLAGIVWYATDMPTAPAMTECDVWLTIHGVTSACSVYVNGTHMGDNCSPAATGPAPSFRVRIDPSLKPAAQKQHIVLRVDSGAVPKALLKRSPWLSLGKRRKPQVEANQQPSNTSSDLAHLPSP